MRSHTIPARHRSRARRVVTAALLAAAAIGGAATSLAGTAAADPPAPVNSPGFAVGPFTHQQCVAAAAHNADYFHRNGGSSWDHTCWSSNGRWYYTSPYAA